ncbi:MICOS complex subunit MIC60-like [Paramacrobiotus metropolitanus]|uniref:MICOS complex subunit MIC60-like n=1 Tax=Paramacrobiotus metropolitanus TaxID=2943436 RepID=UPI0024458996|nr:MICOS complex subunit MIC60-like [Paramacrobiotus metropolitanus]
MWRNLRKLPSATASSSWTSYRAVNGELLPVSRSSQRNFCLTLQKRQQKLDPACDTNPPKSSNAFAKILGSTLLVIAVPVGYALYDPKFRSTLEGYLPFTKPFFNAVTGNSAPSTDKSKAASPSLPSIVRPKEPEKKKPVEIPKKKDEEIKVEKPTPKPSAPLAGAAAATAAAALTPNKSDTEKENKELRKEISAANTKIADLENKVKTLEEYRASSEKAAETPIISDLIAFLGGRKLTDDEKKLVDTVVANTTERLEQEFDAYIEELEDEQEWELQLQLKRQIAAHADAIGEALKRQEGELEQHFQVRLERRLEEERQRFNLQVAGALGRIKGIEEALSRRAKSDKAAHKAQYLWHTSHAFYDAVKYGNTAGKSYEERMVPLSRFVSLAKVFSDSHPFVLSILRAVPEEALVRGVYTEDGLRERFSRLRNAARKVALIDENHSSLYQYFLSYLQSVLVNETCYDLSSQKEFDSTQLDTFRILGTARKCMQRGDVETAVRFIGQLKGEPRKVAQDWLKEARLYLETQQIAKLLLAHASAVGLSTVPMDGRK